MRCNPAWFSSQLALTFGGYNHIRYSTPSTTLVTECALAAGRGREAIGPQNGRLLEYGGHHVRDRSSPPPTPRPLTPRRKADGWAFHLVIDALAPQRPSPTIYGGAWHPESRTSAVWHRPPGMRRHFVSATSSTPGNAAGDCRFPDEKKPGICPHRVCARFFSTV